MWHRYNDNDNFETLPVFIFDNASYFVSSKSQKFLKQTNVRPITISPYSPQLNSVEKLIAAIKSKIKTIWTTGTELNLKFVKKIVDSFTEKTCKRLIESSRLETYFKMKQFIKDNE